MMDIIYHEVAALIAPKKAKWKDTGCTLMTGGATDQRNKPIMNFIAAGQSGLILIRIIDMSARDKTSVSLAEIWEGVIRDDIWVENVNAICTDNAEVMKVAASILHDHPDPAILRVPWIPCTMHCLSLLLRDIAEHPWAAEVMKSAHKIIKFMQNKQKALHIHRSAKGALDLTRPADTQFGTAYVMLEKLYEQRKVLDGVVSSDHWRDARWAGDARVDEPELLNASRRPESRYIDVWADMVEDPPEEVDDGDVLPVDADEEEWEAAAQANSHKDGRDRITSASRHTGGHYEPDPRVDAVWMHREMAEHMQQERHKGKTVVEDQHDDRDRSYDDVHGLTLRQEARATGSTQGSASRTHDRADSSHQGARLIGNTTIVEAHACAGMEYGSATDHVCRSEGSRSAGAQQRVGVEGGAEDGAKGKGRAQREQSWALSALADMDIETPNVSERLPVGRGVVSGVYTRSRAGDGERRKVSSRVVDDDPDDNDDGNTSDEMSGSDYAEEARLRGEDFGGDGDGSHDTEDDEERLQTWRQRCTEVGGGARRFLSSKDVMDGRDGDGPAVLSTTEKTVVAAAAVAIVRRFQIESAAERMKAALSRRLQRLLLQRVLDAPDCITTSQAVVQLCAAIGCGLLPRVTPRWWMRRRAGGTWEDLRVCDDATDDYFREKLRMSRRVFVEISEACAPHVQRQVTFYRGPLQPEQIVAYALYRWATGESYDNITSSFGMGRTSGVRVVRDVTAAILRVYGEKISWPTGVRKQVVLRAFLDKGFPNCHGVVDCTHIYVDKPANVSSENYFDRKHRFFIIAQVVVDLDLRVLDVFMGYLGSCHDIRVIQLSSLSRRTEEGLLFRGPPVTLPGGVTTNGYIFGDNGYPPSEWVVVPYRGINQHPDEERFDTKQKVARGAVERAFRRLKGMWRLFLRTHKTNLDSLPQQFMAVCILHNILLDAGIEFDENLLWEVDANGVRRRVDLGIHRLPQSVSMLTSTREAHAPRNALAQRMKHV
ncbi:hypothetical protein CBR_g52177 [Chara braunii]|uniref:DDE Tnp4 domain-containing protein n=1 Tax=Chara braunii TaxID=69332 RepID=A0A388MA03_CHABU|nr:hypothetical protein CBR_g52177 [Chara braunii]|eukprot:GBG91292.1 hypothetical protein CBR_g52177 [Chara braunii]